MPSKNVLPSIPLEPFGLLFEADLANADIRKLFSHNLKDLLLKNRILIFRGFPPFPKKEDLATYGTLWGELLEWEFGTVFEVVEQENATNYLFTSGSVPYHWDGAFAKCAPWLQIFQCRESPGEGQGGETIFCDTTRVWDLASPQQQRLWRTIKIEYHTKKIAHYGGRMVAPLVSTHPLTNETVLRFAEPPDKNTEPLNTPELIVNGIDEEFIDEFFNDLRIALYSSDVVYRHGWIKNDILIADNHVLLHGRRPFKSTLPRRLWRGHVL